MSNKIKVSLEIFSEKLSPEQISKRLGLKPTKSTKIGEPRIIGEKNGKKIISTVAKEKFNRWTFVSTLPVTATLDSHLEKLLLRLKPYAKKIRALSKNTEVELSCVLYWYDQPTPPLNFNKRIMDAIGGLGASLDIDLYMLGEDE